MSKHLAIYTFAAMLCVALAAKAEILTPQQALERLSSASSAPARVKAFGKASPRLVKSFSSQADDSPTLYMFCGTGADNSYLILSADDIAEPLLAYGDSDEFDPADMPPAMQEWLDGYSEEIAYARANQPDKSLAPRKLGGTNIPERPTILPMVSCRWNQNEPFNLLCPIAPDGKQAVTGCAAAAMAQVMYHWKTPSTYGTGTRQYTCNLEYSGGTAPMDLSIDYANTLFEWDKMKDRYDAGGTLDDDSNRAVATLMAACGIGIEMNYGTTSSGATPAYILNVLKYNLGYSSDMRYVCRYYYTSEEWESLIYGSISHGYPVLYAGKNPTVGHVFVCDGYSYNRYYHINWGWASRSDGYFLFSALNPKDQGIGGSLSGYSSNQRAILYIHPAAAGEAPYISKAVGMETDFVLTSTSDPIKVGSRVSFIGAYKNKGSDDLAYIKPCLQIEYADGTTLVLDSNKELADVRPEHGYNIWSPRVTIPSSLPDGRYVVRPVWKDEDGVVREIMVPVGYHQFYYMDVVDKIITFSADEPAMPYVSEIEIEGDIYDQTPFNLHYDITNRHNGEWRGSVYPMLYSATHTIQEVAYTHIADYTPMDIVLAANETQSHVCACNWEIDPGTYAVAFGVADPDGEITRVSEFRNFTVNPLPADALTYNVGEVRFNALVGKGMHVFNVDIDVDCLTGVGTPLFQVNIYYYEYRNSAPADESLDMATLERITYGQMRANLTAGNKTTVTIPLNIADLAMGNSYRYGVYSTLTTWDNTNTHYYPSKSTFTLGSDNMTGVTPLPDDAAEVVSTKCYDLRGIELTPGQPLPAIYIELTTYRNGTFSVTKRAR